MSDEITKDKYRKMNSEIEKAADAMLAPIHTHSSLMVENADLKAELNSIRNAVFNLCGHLPGISDEELLDQKKVEIEELKDGLNRWKDMAERLVNCVHEFQDHGDSYDCVDALYAYEKL